MEVVVLLILLVVLMLMLLLSDSSWSAGLMSSILMAVRGRVREGFGVVMRGIAWIDDAGGLGGVL